MGNWLSKINGYKTYSVQVITIVASLLVTFRVIGPDDLEKFKEIANKATESALIIGGQMFALWTLVDAVNNILKRRAISRQTATVVAAVNDHTTTVAEVQTEIIQTPIMITPETKYRPVEPHGYDQH